MKISAIFIILVMTLLFVNLVSGEELSREYICKKVLLSLQSNIPSENIVSEIFYEKRVGVPVQTINSYKSNFESFCSSELNIILNPSLLCQKIYYLIINKNYNFSDDDLLTISNKTNVSLNIVNNYIKNNDDLCYKNMYSPQLPKREFPKLVINNTEQCNLYLGNVFELHIPFEIYLGEKECEKEKIVNYFFKIEQFNKEYRIKGIRVFSLVSLILFILILLTVFSFVKSNKKINKLMKL